MRQLYYKVEQLLHKTISAREITKNHPQLPRFIIDTLHQLNKFHFSHFPFSDIARFNSYDDFLAGLADYEIKTRQSLL